MKRKMMFKVPKVAQVADQTHLMFDGEIKNKRAYDASCRIDCRRDAAWFRKHPGVAERTRAITKREVKGFGFPKTATVRVVRMPDGNVWRIFPDRNDRPVNA